jgi:hypothetical protein
MTTGATASDRARLRAQLFMRGVLPLLEQLVAARPQLVPQDLPATRIHLGLAQGGLGADVLLSAGSARVVAADAVPQAGLAIVFRDAAQLNRFFSGKPCWPRLRGALRHPRQLMLMLRLLMALQILQPRKHAPRERDERALQVRVLLLLVVRALAELARSGATPFASWAAESPERVIQWSAGPSGQDPDHVAVFLRMAQGRVQVGRGLYAHREPFVHLAFRDVDAAYTMLTSPDSQMTGLRDGLLATIGSPEYVRKLALQMQHIDQLLLEG